MGPWAFVLAVPDMNRSAEYFRDVLGFRTSWEDAADWRLAERDGVRIMLGQCPTDMHPSALGSHNWFGYLDAMTSMAYTPNLLRVGQSVLRPRIPTMECVRLS
jgi:catechol 2,3-dioxygenase-like lactoylglutathione lyase family enzyme